MDEGRRDVENVGVDGHGKSNVAGGEQRDRIRRVLSIEEPDSISPLMLGKNKDVDDFSLDRSSKQHRAKVAKRISGRFSISQLETARESSNDVSVPLSLPEQAQDETHHGYRHMVGTMIEDISGWLHAERERRRARRIHLKGTPKHRDMRTSSGDEQSSLAVRSRSASADSSNSSDSAALHKLELILARHPSRVKMDRFPSRKSSLPRRRPGSFRKLRQQSTLSSDTEYEVEAIIPNCEAICDNSKTVSFLTGSMSNLDLATSGKQVTKERHAWLEFKYEILRLTHTLRLKGWRRIPMEKSSEIDVERLSGALTNAVYVVSPPIDEPSRSEAEMNGSTVPEPRQPPDKLLLRIYGPQVEHLIDRDVELQILRRLARKNIGPRLLGTFTNGRFEQYFHARTLKPEDLRHADTSKQIAMRMRELHDGIELLEDERTAGPFVWRNWDKWVDRCEKVVSFMDQQALALQTESLRNSGPTVAKPRLVCGTDWKLFRRTVDQYRKWLDAQYGGSDKLSQRLIFAHNDTQYGNILRAEPSGQSPLLLPANKHKQLIVIDFEYANANMRGCEFANHFTEWCYNYHDAKRPFACNSARYPTVEEQSRFIRAYVLHRPHYAPAASSTPRVLPQDYLATSLASLTATSYTAISTVAQNVKSSVAGLAHNLRAPHNRQPHTATDNPYFPSTSSTTGEEHSSTNAMTKESSNSTEEDNATAAEIAGLLRETRLWRIANHAQWVAWGVVQAIVPGFIESDKVLHDTESGLSQEPESLEAHRGIDLMEGTDPLSDEVVANRQDLDDRRPEGHHGESETPGNANDQEGAGEEEFDYLSYARERAMFFWGDCLQLGLVTEDQLEPWAFAEDIKHVIG